MRVEQNDSTEKNYEAFEKLWFNFFKSKSSRELNFDQQINKTTWFLESINWEKAIQIPQFAFRLLPFITKK